LSYRRIKFQLPRQKPAGLTRGRLRYNLCRLMPP